MPIAAGFLPHVQRPPKVGQNCFKVGDDRLHSLGFRVHPKQGLLEIQVQRQRASDFKRELRILCKRRGIHLRTRQFENLSLQLQRVRNIFGPG
jgi:hypothetical protein